jgi:drug/metabolite transporter (DMT)-like permease
VSDATRATAWNFLLALPLGLVTSAIFVGDFAVTTNGMLLAVVSGALTSGLGYVVWYAALKDLATSDAATIQLSVPVIAAIGGVALLSEPVTMRLVIATIATLGGVAIVLRQRASAARPDR